MPPRIRDLNWRHDRNAVLEFQREVYEVNFPGFVANEGFLRDYSNQLRRALGSWAEHLWVIEDDHRTAGFIWVALQTTLVDPCIGYIKNVYVEPSLRGQGWGKLLLATAEAWIVQHGATKCALDASVCNQAAVGLYDSQGYNIVRHRMEKRLEV